MNSVPYPVFQAIFLAMFLLPVPLIGAAISIWRAPSQVAWWALALSAISYTLLLCLALVWAQTSLILRPLLWLLLGITLASAWRLPQLPLGQLTAWSGLLLLITLFVFLPALLRAWQGHRQPPGAVALEQVLTGGTFVVEEGGNSAMLNYHMKYAPLRYAVDFIGVGSLGRHANGLLPADPNRYAIFGASVLAPCDAVVEQAMDGIADLPGPHTDSQHPAGNHLVLLATLAAGGPVRIALAHLKQGSLRVQVCQRVQMGQVIAQVGHSGNSSEPHLHLGVVQGDPWHGKGLPFTLEGRFPVRGMIFKGQ